jgi:hypothetical protein
MPCTAGEDKYHAVVLAWTASACSPAVTQSVPQPKGRGAKSKAGGGGDTEAHTLRVAEVEVLLDILQWLSPGKSLFLGTRAAVTSLLLANTPALPKHKWLPQALCPCPALTDIPSKVHCEMALSLVCLCCIGRVTSGYPAEASVKSARPLSQEVVTLLVEALFDKWVQPGVDQVLP